MWACPVKFKGKAMAVVGDLDSVLAANGISKDHPMMKKRITAKNRNKIAAKITDWKSCAVSLGLSDQDVDDIMEENKRVRNQRAAMLRQWAETYGNEATYLKLAEALADIRRRDLVELLLSVMSSNQTSQRPRWSIARRASNINKSEYSFVQRIRCLLPSFAHRRFLYDMTFLGFIFVFFLGTPTLVYHNLKDEYDPDFKSQSKELRPFTLNQTLCTDVFVSHDLPTIANEIFVGREEELRKVIKMMDTVHIVGIHGAPGFGKSTLAIYVGYEMVRTRGAMVRYIDVVDKFSHLTSMDTMPVNFDSESDEGSHQKDSTLSSNMQLQEQEIKTSLAFIDNNFERIRDVMMQELLWWSKTIQCHTVLILDNFDDLLNNLRTRDAFIKLIEKMIYNSKGNLFVIITSRQKLLTLSDFNFVVVNELSTNSSIEILSTLAPNISKEDTELIVSHVDGCPLALKIVGMLLRFNGGRLTEMLKDQLRNHPLEVLDKESLHQKRFRVIMDSIFNHLAHLKDCGYYISLIPGSFTYTAGQYIIPNSMSCVDGLLLQSLIDEYHLANQTRYRMHRLIREYFKEVGESYKEYYVKLQLEFDQLFVEYFTNYLVNFADKLRNESISAFDQFVFESDQHNIRYVLQLLLSKTDDLSVIELHALAFAIDQELVSTSSIISSQLLHIMIGKIDEVCFILSSEKCGELFSHVIQKLYAQCSCKNIKEYFKQFSDRRAPCMELFQCNVVQIINKSDPILSQLPQQEKLFISRIHRLHCGADGYRLYHFVFPYGLITAVLYCQFEYDLFYGILVKGDFSSSFHTMLIVLFSFIYHTYFNQAHVGMMVWITVFFPAIIQLLFKIVLFIICIIIRLLCHTFLDRLQDCRSYRLLFGIMLLPLSYFDLFIFWNLVPYCC